MIDLDLPGPGAHAVAYALIATGAVLVLLAGGYVFDSVAYSGKVHPGVRVSGVDLGGLTPAQASARLGKDLGPRYKQPVVATFEDKKWSIAPSVIGAELDVNTTVNKAMGVTRQKGFVGDSFTRLVTWVVPAEVEPATTVDPNAVDAQLDAIAKVVRIPTMDAAVVVDGARVSVKPPRPGRELDRASARKAIVSNLPKGKDRAFALAVPGHEPGVSEASAQAAAEQAAKLVASGATVKYKANTWDLSTDDIAKSVGFVVVAAGRENDAASLVPSGSADPPAGSAGLTGPVALAARIDPVKLGKVLGPRVGGLGQPARDARFETSAGRVTIVPSQVGLGPDMRTLARDLTSSLRQPAAASRVAALRLGETQPKMTTEKARSYGIEERISTYSTTFDGGNIPRVNNIRTLAKSLDGSLIPPGGTWSFNGQVGERTAEKGYQEANAIVDGRLVPQLGGGICQVATTVFNAIFLSGEPVVERQNHSFYISHYPKGRDATVTWGGADLKFKNDTGKWILIKTATDSDSVTVSLYGTSPGYQVSSTTSELKKTSDYPTDTIDDAQLPSGTRVVKDGGLPGYDCTVIRTVKKGGTVVRTDTFVSHYKPKVEIVLVGTMPEAPVSKPTTKTSGN